MVHSRLRASRAVHREEAGLTHSEVARRLEWSASKLSRIGLLQTEDYARAVIRAGQARPDPETLERRLTARMARQEILTRPDPPEIWAVLDEPARSAARTSCVPSSST
jgi:hypothetical protein